MITHEKITELIVKYFSRKASDDEKRMVEDWKNANPENESLFNDYSMIWQCSEQDPILFQPNAEQALEKIKPKIILEKESKMISLPLVYKIAAGLVLLAVSVFLLRSFIGKENEVYLTKETMKETQDIMLPDGTIVTLNESSIIRYPEKFSGTREVYFEGEAYFVVAKDPEHPFIITSQNSIVEVLGTEFNLRARNQDENVEIMVTEGKVAFSDLEIKNPPTILLAGEKAVLKKNESRIEKTTLEDENFMAWKTGKLVFRNAPLDKVVEEMSSFYRHEMVLSSKELASKRLTSTFDQLPLNEALKVLELSLNVKIDTLNETIIIAETLPSF